jgi:hypothetical protein
MPEKSTIDIAEEPQCWEAVRGFRDTVTRSIDSVLAAREVRARL